MAAVAGSDLIRRQTSNPSMSGSLTSRMTRSGRAATSRRASLPVSASWTAKPARVQGLRDGVSFGQIVVDEQDPGVGFRSASYRLRPVQSPADRARPWSVSRGPRAIASSRDLFPLERIAPLSVDQAHALVLIENLRRVDDDRDIFWSGHQT